MTRKNAVLIYLPVQSVSENKIGERASQTNNWMGKLLTRKKCISGFYVLLTMHLSTILVINQLDAQNLVL